MSTSLNVAQWSVTAADNADSDAGLPVMSDTMDPIGLDNVPRGMMAALAKWRQDIGGAIEAAGTANALTANTSSGYEAAHLVDGLMVVVRAATDNTNATVTLNVDSTGAKGVKRADGSALAIGSIKADQYLILFYNADNSEWWAANISPELNAIAGNLAIGGTLGVTGAVTLSSTLTVTGAAAFNGGGTLGDGSGDTVVIKGTTVNSFSSGLLNNTSASDWRSDLSLGTAATQNTGTSGANVPLLNANNTHSGNLTVSGTFSASGTATLGDGSGDTVVIKGTTVNSFSSGLLNNTSAGDWRTDLGIDTDDGVTFGSVNVAGTVNAATLAIGGTNLLASSSFISSMLNNLSQTASITGTANQVYYLLLDSDGVFKLARGTAVQLNLGV